MAWRRGRGQFNRWPGQGPFSYLPPWQRPGWIYGPGACWWLNNPAVGVAPQEELSSLINQKSYIEAQLKTLQETLNQLQKRIGELQEQID
ncbi:MAG: hypothetical protein ACTSW4_04940 [Candidatus Ranarchaeia archaeon]